MCVHPVAAFTPLQLASYPGLRYFGFLMKKMSVTEMKRQEADSRMEQARKARRSPKAAARLQHRASLVGNGSNWRITNMNDVARAIARWD